MKPNYHITIQLKDKTLWVTEGFSLDDGINNLIDETEFDKNRFIKEIHSILAKNFKDYDYRKSVNKEKSK